MPPVASKMKMYSLNVARGASPTLRRRRRAFYATSAFRSLGRGDERMAQAYVAFALNNGARLGDLARAGRQTIKDEDQLDRWLGLLRKSPGYSSRANLMQMSRSLSAQHGVPPLTEEQIGALAGDNAPDKLRREALIEQGVAATVPAASAITQAYGAPYWSAIDVPSAKSKHKRSDDELSKTAARTTTETSKYIYDPGRVYLRTPYVTGADWREITTSKSKCLFAAKKDSKGRPMPPEDARWGTDAFDLWVAGLCYSDSREKALEAEAEGLATMATQIESVNTFVAKMIDSIKETERQQAINLDAVFKGLPPPYKAPPTNAQGVSNLYVLPPNYAVDGLPVNPASWQGKNAQKGPPAPPGAIAGQMYTLPTVQGPPQQVVDPMTGQVTVVPGPTGTVMPTYPAGPLPPTYPMQPGETYPGYTPPPPPPAEESLAPKKKKKKSSMTLPLVLGVGALGVGALVVIRSRR
jgi:hypothetical protein